LRYQGKTKEFSCSFLVAQWCFLTDKSKQLLKLQREWYKRLKSEGFSDIESMDQDGSMDSPMMSRTASGLAYRYDSSVEEYYRLARHFLYQGAFESDIAKHCWELHADGSSYREIVKSLPENGFYPYELFWVQGLIRRIQAQMYRVSKITRETQQQLDLFNGE
jgi:hypothetical protein